MVHIGMNSDIMIILHWSGLRICTYLSVNLSINIKPFHKTKEGLHKIIHSGDVVFIIVS